MSCSAHLLLIIIIISFNIEMPITHLPSNKMLVDDRLYQRLTRLLFGHTVDIIYLHLCLGYQLIWGGTPVNESIGHCLPSSDDVSVQLLSRRLLVCTKHPDVSTAQEHGCNMSP